MLEYLDINNFLRKKADLYNFINPFFDENYRRSHNFFYIILGLFVYRNYLDNIYIKVDPKIKLDLNQKIAILSQNKNILILAGAGAGKTTTVAAKIKFMVEILKINPQEILLLSYTNEAVAEMKKIICDKFNINVSILTFHKFAILLTKNKRKIVDSIDEINFIKNFKLIYKIMLYLYLYTFYDLKLNDLHKNTTKFKISIIDFIADCSKRYYEHYSYR